MEARQGMAPNLFPDRELRLTPREMVYWFRSLTVLRTVRVFFFSPRLAFSIGFCGLNRSSSYTDFSTSRMAIPAVPGPHLARPARWTNIDIDVVNFHYTIRSIFGMLHPCRLLPQVS